MAKAMRNLLPEWMLLTLSAVASGIASPVSNGSFSLRILHTNDMHSRFEQISKLGGKCFEHEAATNNCYGGFARLLTAVKMQRQKASEEDLPLLFLNAGDTFQGTAWYTVHKWRVVSALTNLLSIDAMSLGNHEFDDGVEGLVPFLKEYKFPILACNVDVEDEPEMEKVPLKPSRIFDISGHQVGVIGYLTPETLALSRTGKVKIHDEIDNITTEAEKMKREGVKIVIAVGHSGFETDLRIAREVPDVDVVVGGHTNTFLYTGEPPSSEVPVNLYPVIVSQPSGRKVAVVQAYAYTKYLGVLNLKFDGSGELLEASGNPQLMNHRVAQDADMLSAMEPWKKEIAKLTAKELGKSKVFLSGDCRFFECNFGNLITDAFVDYVLMNSAGSGWTTAAIAIQQAGGIRASIDAHRKNYKVTLEDIIISMPFFNTLYVMELKGKHLLEALEHGVLRYDPHRNIGRGEFLQFSGMKVAYNLNRPPGSRVVRALARCKDCDIPQMAPIEKELSYNVIMPSFLANGGDNFTMIPKYGNVIVKYEKMDTDIVADFIKDRKIIYSELQGRISFQIDDDLSATNNLNGASHLVFNCFATFSLPALKYIIG